MKILSLLKDEDCTLQGAESQEVIAVETVCIYHMFAIKKVSGHWKSDTLPSIL